MIIWFTVASIPQVNNLTENSIDSTNHRKRTSQTGKRFSLQ